MVVSPAAETQRLQSEHTSAGQYEQERHLIISALPIYGQSSVMP